MVCLKVFGIVMLVKVVLSIDGSTDSLCLMWSVCYWLNIMFGFGLIDKLAQQTWISVFVLQFL